MKKVLFAVALVMGLGSSVAFAGNMVSDVEIVGQRIFLVGKLSFKRIA